MKLIPYLFNKLEYILRKFQSYALESRFGHYRQLSGENYYISYMQLWESGRKVRFECLVYLSCYNDEISLKTLLPSKETIRLEVEIEPFDYELMVYQILFCRF